MATPIEVFPGLFYPGKGEHLSYVEGDGPVFVLPVGLYHGPRQKGWARVPVEEYIDPESGRRGYRRRIGPMQFIPWECCILVDGTNAPRHNRPMRNTLRLSEVQKLIDAAKEAGFTHDVSGLESCPGTVFHNLFLAADHRNEFTSLQILVTVRKPEPSRFFKRRTSVLVASHQYIGNTTSSRTGSWNAWYLIREGKLRQNRAAERAAKAQEPVAAKAQEPVAA